MESLASQARPVAVLWLAGFLEAARLHRVISLCASSKALSIRIAQCFLLNGFIFLGSLLTLKSVVMPTLLWILPEECDKSTGQYLCDRQMAVVTYSFLRSGLTEIFYVFWFYPLYVFSLILSTLWYNDIAKHALDVVKSKSLDSTQSLDSYNIAESEDRPDGFDTVALGIGEQAYSLLLLAIFFAEVSVIGYIPYFGKAMNFVLLSLMYAYYCFDYKWNFFAVSLNKRLDFFESNWAFFAGFGGPCVLPIFFLSPLTSYGVMAMLYPLKLVFVYGWPSGYCWRTVCLICNTSPKLHEMPWICAYCIGRRKRTRPWTLIIFCIPCYDISLVLHVLMELELCDTEIAFFHCNVLIDGSGWISMVHGNIGVLVFVFRTL